MSNVVRFFLCAALLASLAAAQKRTSTAKASAVNASKLTTLKVVGTTIYTDKEILAASGLLIGQNAADGDFKEAVQRLGNSGVFADLSYSYTSSPLGTKLEVQLSDVDRSKLVPAQFENFVWFRDDELKVLLKERVPLFTGMLPLSGNLPDHISEALQSILGDKQLPGRVSYLREAHDETGGAVVAIDYRVEEVDIRIRNLEFPGATPDQISLLTPAGRQLVGASYNRVAVAAVAKHDLLPVYLQRGYLKAEFGQVDAHSAQKTTSDQAQNSDELQVDAIIPVAPGKVYATASVDWKGNSSIAVKELASLVHLPPGEPVDAIRLVEDLKRVQKLYGSRGYINTHIETEKKFDDETSKVHYVLTVTEGDLYKMGELEIRGLDTQATARLRSAWSLAEGQPFNVDYPKRFVADIQPLLPRSVRWGTNIHVTPDAKDKSVDVELRFIQQ